MGWYVRLVRVKRKVCDTVNNNLLGNDECAQLQDGPRGSVWTGTHTETIAQAFLRNDGGVLVSSDFSKTMVGKVK